MSCSRAERFSESDDPETPGSAEYDVKKDFMKGFKLQPKIPRSPHCPEQCSSRRNFRQSSNGANDDRASTSSRCFGYTRLQTYDDGYTDYDSTGPGEPDWPNLLYTESLRHYFIDNASRFPLKLMSINQQENTGTTHCMQSTSMAVEEEYIIEEKTKVNENRNDIGRRTMCDFSNASPRRDIFHYSQDENQDEPPNGYYYESESTPKDEQTESVSDSSIDKELSTSNSSFDNEDEYINELRSRQRRIREELNARIRSPRLINAREFEVYSARFSGSPSSSRLPPHAGINISVNCTSSSILPRTTVRRIGLDSNKKEDVMRQIVDLQSIVDRNNLQHTQIQELLLDLYKRIDTMQIYV